MKLVDISYFCKGSQSSLSEWSKIKESQNVLNNNNYEYAFHTAFEEEPWFCIELPYETSVYELLIHNRRNPKFYSVCKYISVFISLDGKKWDKVHVNDKNYGFGEKALKIDLIGGKKCKFIKICNKNNYFYASRINIFVNKNDNSDITILSDRRDGLCQRVIGMLETMAVADYFGFNFGFTWINNKEDDHFHDVKKVGDMFSRSFIDSHYISDGVKKRIRFGDVFFTPSAKEVIGNEHYVIDYYRLYLRIKFSTEIVEATSAVDKLKLPEDMIGIHLRAGDIIYGMHKNNPMFISKVLEFPFVLHILEVENHSKVILIGQDQDFIEIIKHTYQVKSSDDFYYENITSLQKIFFDIQLFVKCKKVYGADSGPILLANSISKRALINPHQDLEDDEKLRILKKWLLKKDAINSSIPDLQIAYACFAYISYGFNDEKKEDLVAVNNVAREKNKANRLYDIFDLFLQYGFLENEEAEKNVLEYITIHGTTKFPVKGYDILFRNGLGTTRLNHNLQYTQKLKSIIQNATDKLPYANLLLGLACYYTDAYIEAGLYFRKYIEEERVSQMPDVVRGFFEGNKISIL